MNTNSGAADEEAPVEVVGKAREVVKMVQAARAAARRWKPVIVGVLVLYGSVRIETVVVSGCKVSVVIELWKKRGRGQGQQKERGAA